MSTRTQPANDLEHQMQNLKLKVINFGEPDANAEYVIASKSKTDPIFISAYTDPPIDDLQRFEQGTKFILHGQKGTGKTAILRSLHDRARKDNRLTEFVVFRNEIIEERDLLDFNWPFMLDEEKLKTTRHYLHTIKRILLLILVRILSNQNSSLPDDIPHSNEADRSWLASLYDRVKRLASADVVNVALETVVTTITSVTVDMDAVNRGPLKADASRLLKRQNDTLLNAFIRMMKRSNKAMTLFLDELHFAYRDENTLSQDAMLIRDTILAVCNLNERFIRENLDCTIIMSFREEFLEHPLIATVEVNNAIASYGSTLSWADFPADDDHPMLRVAAKRVALSTGSHFGPRDLFETFLKCITPSRFIYEVTWSKPRDLIRFFNTAKRMYGQSASLDQREFNAVWRDYSRQAWLEIKTAASSFMPPIAVIELENALRNLAPQMRSRDYPSFKEYTKRMEGVYKRIEKYVSGTYSFEHFMQLLYVLGIYYTRTPIKSGELIYQSYHRGARYPSEEGSVLLHQSVTRAFG